jgi:hypothetical protein
LYLCIRQTGNAGPTARCRLLIESAVPRKRNQARKRGIPRPRTRVGWKVEIQSAPIEHLGSSKTGM